HSAGVGRHALVGCGTWGAESTSDDRSGKGICRSFGYGAVSGLHVFGGDLVLPGEASKRNGVIRAPAPPCRYSCAPRDNDAPRLPHRTGMRDRRTDSPSLLQHRAGCRASTPPLSRVRATCGPGLIQTLRGSCSATQTGETLAFESPL